METCPHVGETPSVNTVAKSVGGGGGSGLAFPLTHCMQVISISHQCSHSE